MKPSHVEYFQAFTNASCCKTRNHPIITYPLLFWDFHYQTLERMERHKPKWIRPTKLMLLCIGDCAKISHDSPDWIPPVHWDTAKPRVAMVCLKWHWLLLLCLAKNDAMDSNRYEDFFMNNWPIFEKITEKVVRLSARMPRRFLTWGCGPGQPALLIGKTSSNARVHGPDV